MTTCQDNCTEMKMLDGIITNEMLISSWDSVADYFDYQPWVCSLLASAIVGLSGIFPLLIIPIDDTANSKHGAGAGTLKLLLSFAVGGLLGDVFLHLLPEAWSNNSLNINSTKEHPSMSCGLWVLTGFLLFIITEKIFIGTGGKNDDDNDDEEDYINTVKTEKANVDDVSFNNHSHDKKMENNNLLLINGKIPDQIEKNLDINECETKNNYIINSNCINIKKNGVIKLNNCNGINTDGEMQRIESSKCFENKKIFNRNTNGNIMKNITTDNSQLNGKIDDQLKVSEKRETKVKTKHISGYLNLLANCIDNFTHGLAVGGAFLVSFRLGALTTLAILIHEIPHEVGDFAILLKSGFNRWDAARAQLITASGGILGALAAVLCSGSGVETRTSWILPFTAGGFLHIGLVTILPELQRESDPKESMKQLGALLSGITIMAILTTISN